LLLFQHLSPRKPRWVLESFS